MPSAERWPPMSSKYVLDSSALLAVINEEPGSSMVEERLGHCVLSAVNLAETIGKLTQEGVPADEVCESLIDMVQNIVPFDETLAFLAGRMAPQTKAFGLSLGDRACLATAEHLKLEVLTADKIWNKLKLPIKIKLIR